MEFPAVFDSWRLHLGGGGGHGDSRFCCLGGGKNSLGRRWEVGKGEKRILRSAETFGAQRARFAQVNRIGIFFVMARKLAAAVRLLDLLGGGESLVDALEFLEAVFYYGGLDVVFCDEDWF